MMNESSLLLCVCASALVSDSNETSPCTSKAGLRHRGGLHHIWQRSGLGKAIRDWTDSCYLAKWMDWTTWSLDAISPPSMLMAPTGVFQPHCQGRLISVTKVKVIGERWPTSSEICPPNVTHVPVEGTKQSFKRMRWPFGTDTWQIAPPPEAMATKCQGWVQGQEQALTVKLLKFYRCLYTRDIKVAEAWF